MSLLPRKGQSFCHGPFLKDKLFGCSSRTAVLRVPLPSFFFSFFSRRRCFRLSLFSKVLPLPPPDSVALDHDAGKMERVPFFLWLFLSFLFVRAGIYARTRPPFFPPYLSISLLMVEKVRLSGPHEPYSERSLSRSSKAFSYDLVPP